MPKIKGLWLLHLQKNSINTLKIKGVKSIEFSDFTPLVLWDVRYLLYNKYEIRGYEGILYRIILLTHNIYKELIDVRYDVRYN